MQSFCPNLIHITRFFDRYDFLLNDIYPQPEDEGHYLMAKQVINKFLLNLPECKSVLDVGCGEAFVKDLFDSLGIKYDGVGLGVDIPRAHELGRKVHMMDFNFLDFYDKSFDLIFSRHSLEHSPFPILTLMEWHRVSKKYLLLVMPTPDYWTYVGRNHYFVAPKEQIEFWLQLSGWQVIEDDDTDEREIRLLCEKTTMDNRE